MAEQWGDRVRVSKRRQALSIIESETTRLMNEEQLRALVRRYSRLIHSAVAGVAGRHAAILGDDVEQNVMIALWKAMPGEKIPDHPSSYIYRTAVRETVRLVRRIHETVGLSAEIERSGDEPLPDAVVEYKELGGAIRDALQEVSPDRRRAVKAHLMGFTVREMMVMYEWPYNKARNLISRGMGDLRRKLRARGYGV